MARNSGRDRRVAASTLADGFLAANASLVEQLQRDRSQIAGQLASTSRALCALAEAQGLRDGALADRVEELQHKLTTYFDARRAAAPSRVVFRGNEPPDERRAKVAGGVAALRYWKGVGRAAWCEYGTVLRVLQAQLRTRGYSDASLDLQLDCLEYQTLGFDVTSLVDNLNHVLDYLKAPNPALHPTAAEDGTSGRG